MDQFQMLVVMLKSFSDLIYTKYDLTNNDLVCMADEIDDALSSMQEILLAEEAKRVGVK